MGGTSGTVQHAVPVLFLGIDPRPSWSATRIEACSATGTPWNAGDWRGRKLGRRAGTSLPGLRGTRPHYGAPDRTWTGHQFLEYPLRREGALFLRMPGSTIYWPGGLIRGTLTGFPTPIRESPRQCGPPTHSRPDGHWLEVRRNVPGPFGVRILPTETSPAARHRASFPPMKRHWPEYLTEAAGLGVLMISACTFGALLFHPASPVAGALPRIGAQRPHGVRWRSRWSPWSTAVGDSSRRALPNPAVTLTFPPAGKDDPRAMPPPTWSHSFSAASWEWPSRPGSVIHPG